jgi:large subunit ribosomal protein L7/L12
VHELRRPLVPRRRLQLGTIIKNVRELTGLGLKDAKDLVEQTPSTILSELSRPDAKAAAEKLRAAGAVVEIR